jgi:FG-GAP repeat
MRCDVLLVLFTGNSISGQSFGAAVAIDAGLVLVGAPGYQNNLDQGIAYLYQSTQVSGGSEGKERKGKRAKRHK